MRLNADWGESSSTQSSCWYVLSLRILTPVWSRVTRIYLHCDILKIEVEQHFCNATGVYFRCIDLKFNAPFI